MITEQKYYQSTITYKPHKQSSMNSNNQSIVLQIGSFLVAVMFFCACNQPNTVTQAAKVAVEAIDEIDANSAASYNPYIIAEIQDWVESAGFASGDKGKKDTLGLIIKAIKNADHQQAATMIDKYKATYGEDEKLKQIINTTATIPANTTNWKGGTPGRVDSWNEPRNWSTNDIPNEDSHVVINAGNSGHNAQPVISDHVQVASINIMSNAKLTIRKTGDLLVDGTDTFSEGVSLRGGQIQVDGKIRLKNIDATELRSKGLRAMADAGSTYHSDWLGAIVTLEE